MFGTGPILEGAFRLVRERPGAVAIWGLVYFLCVAGMMLAMGPFFAAVANQGGAPNPAGLLGMISGIFLLELLLLLVLVVLFAAAFRAVLRPEQSGFGYLRVGMDELRLLGLGLLVGIGSLVAYFVAATVIGVVTGLLAVTAGRGISILVSVVLFVALLAGFLYVQVRLSLAGPLSVYRGRFAIGEAWALTRGRFWAIFLAYAVVFVILMIAQAIVSAVTIAPLLGGIMSQARNPQDPAAAQAATMQMMSQFTTFSPLMIGVTLFGAIVGALWVALNGGAAATAARLLAGGREAEAFE